MPVQLSRETLQSLLVKGWLTHDAMWFMHCMQAVGMEKTNEINRAAVWSMAGIEIKRMSKALGVERVADLAQLRQFMTDAMSILDGDYMDFRVDFQEPDRMTARMLRCFAYDGMARLGVEDKYQCGVFTRIDAWLHGLGLTFRATPELSGCQMHSQGRCQREYSLSFPA